MHFFQAEVISPGPRPPGPTGNDTAGWDGKHHGPGPGDPGRGAGPLSCHYRGVPNRRAAGRAGTASVRWPPISFARMITSTTPITPAPTIFG